MSYTNHMTSASDQDSTENLDDRARAILEQNDHGTYTIPSENVYPHQWLWDSCFIAIGQRHYNVDRAKTEILSLLRGQWTNGMLPSIIFNNDHAYHRDRDFWHSQVSPFSPDSLTTTGITQPPMLAEAVVQIGKKLSPQERRSWYRMVLPNLISYHQWLYQDRDPHQEGLVLQIHPWETGLDNTPPWMSELESHVMPLWIRIIGKLHFDAVINLFRRDTRAVPISQRFSTLEVLALFDAQRRLRRKGYNIDRILDHSLFAIEDLGFNSIFIRANKRLTEIAKFLRVELPEELTKQMARTTKTFEELWDPYTEEYYSRDFITHRLIKESSIAALLPLYAGTISQERADLLVRMLENEHIFGLEYPVPSVPANSAWFKPKTYWQGPTWLNTNWLIIDGLKRYGYKEQAAALTQKSLELVTMSGFREYFDPNNGEGAGIDNFSWTAALTIDLLNS